MSSPMMSVRVWASRQIFKLPAAWEPGTHSLIHRRVTLAQQGTPSLLQPPPVFSTVRTHLLCSWPQNFKKPVHRETRKSRELTGPKVSRVPVLRSLLSACPPWRLHTCSSEQNSPLFLFKGFREVRFFFQTTLSEVESDVSQ